MALELARWRNVGGVGGGAAVVAAQGMKMFCTKALTLPGDQMAAMTIVCLPDRFQGQIHVDPTSKENHPLVPIQPQMNLKERSHRRKKEKFNGQSHLEAKILSYCHEKDIIFAKKKRKQVPLLLIQKLDLPTNWLKQYFCSPLNWSEKMDGTELQVKLIDFFLIGKLHRPNGFQTHNLTLYPIIMVGKAS